MSLPGALPPGALFPGRNGNQPQQPQDPYQRGEQMMIKFMMGIGESCPFKTIMAGTMGFGMGGMFGLFMSSMRYDTPLTPAGQAIASLPLRQQLKTGFKEMGRASWSSAKNFGLIGAIYAGTECCIEGYRGKADLNNSVSAGCITGGIISAKAGPQAALLGCAGFAAFSAAIDAYMHMPSEGTGGPIL